MTQSSPPKIDFYVVTDNAVDAHWRQACRLVEQVVDEGKQVFVCVSSAEDAKRIDELLWTFGDRSFLPHEILLDDAASQQASHHAIKVLIGAEPPADFRDVLVNLSHRAIKNLASLHRIVELVPVDAQLKRLARERFKHYRDGGIEPTTHNT